MKKMTSIYLSAMAAAIALISTPVHAVVIDTTGGHGGGAVYDVQSLDWAQDNALAIGALSTPALTAGGTGAPGQLVGESYFRTVAQGALSVFGTSTGRVAPTGREFTFQVSFYEFASGIGGATSGFRLAPALTPDQNFFRIYADTASDSNQITGANYGNGTLIYEGTVVANDGVYTDNTLRTGAADSTLPLLDKFGTDDQHGVVTHRGSGSNDITVQTSFLNQDYFLGNTDYLTLFLTYMDSTNLTTPFISANPSDKVVGFTPNYSNVNGRKINGGSCAAGGGITENGVTSGQCDFHFQSDASGAFNVPEPSTLALFGLALLGLGATVRRKKN